MKKYKVIPSVYLILVKDTKILFLKRKNTGYMDGKFSLIAGHVEDNESLINAIIREANEEAGIDIKEEDLDLVHIMQRIFTDKNLDDRVDYYFIAKKWTGIPYNREPNLCDKLEWYESNYIPNNTIPLVKEALGFVKNKKLLSFHKEGH